MVSLLGHQCALLKKTLETPQSQWPFLKTRPPRHRLVDQGTALTSAILASGGGHRPGQTLRAPLVLHQPSSRGNAMSVPVENRWPMRETAEIRGRPMPLPTEARGSE